MRRLKGVLALAAAAGAAGIGAGRLAGSDHQDTPEVELSPRSDINDVYAFPGADTTRLVLVMTTSSPITPAQSAGAAFDPDLLYQIKIDQSGTDGVEDQVLQFTFTGTSAAAQQVEMRMGAPALTGMFSRRLESAPVVSGAINTPLGGSGGVQLFAGVRDDPFFLDLEQFFCIIPDRRPVSGALAGACATGVAGSFRSTGAAVDYLSGFNTLAIVVEMPKTMVRATPGKVGVWGTISR